MILQIVTTLCAAVLGGVLYRQGGTGKPYNTKHRDFGVPAIALILVWTFAPPLTWQMGLATFLTFGLMFGTMTTYFKKKGEPVRWYNWLLVGFFFGLSSLPVSFILGGWLGMGIRTAVLMLTITLWSELISNDWWEEFGRGFLFVVTIPLIFLGV